MKRLLRCPKIYFCMENHHLSFTIIIIVIVTRTLNRRTSVSSSSIYTYLTKREREVIFQTSIKQLKTIKQRNNNQTPRINEIHCLSSEFSQMVRTS
jgi:hypothetical protein